MSESEDITYAGFWIRVLASSIDSILILMITLPLLIGIYGTGYFDSTHKYLDILDFLISWLLPAIAVIIFWICKSATPEKLITKTKIIDQKSGGKLSIVQSLVRYFSYYISILPLFLGIIWVAFDKKKQGWHDKIAGTVVVKVS
jgi:uncharacterized RDD family membrane protein YckC